MKCSILLVLVSFFANGIASSFDAKSFCQKEGDFRAFHLFPPPSCKFVHCTSREEGTLVDCADGTESKAKKTVCKDNCINRQPVENPNAVGRLPEDLAKEICDKGDFHAFHLFPPPSCRFVHCISRENATLLDCADGTESKAKRSVCKNSCINQKSLTKTAKPKDKSTPGSVPKASKAVERQQPEAVAAAKPKDKSTPRSVPKASKAAERQQSEVVAAAKPDLDIETVCKRPRSAQVQFTQVDQCLYYDCHNMTRYNCTSVPQDDLWKNLCYHECNHPTGLEVKNAPKDSKDTSIPSDIETVCKRPGRPSVQFTHVDQCLYYDCDNMTRYNCTSAPLDDLWKNLCYHDCNPTGLDVEKVASAPRPTKCPPNNEPKELPGSDWLVTIRAVVSLISDKYKC